MENDWGSVDKYITMIILMETDCEVLFGLCPMMENDEGVTMRNTMIVGAC